MTKKELSRLKKKAKIAVDSATAWGKTPEGKIHSIALALDTAEVYIRQQLMPETDVCIATLKDIRRIVRS